MCIPRSIALLLFPLCLASLSALEFRDYQTVGVTLDSSGAAGANQYTGILNISNPGSPSSIVVPSQFPSSGTYSDAGGYDPASMKVSAARLIIWISDNNDGGRSDTLLISVKSQDNQPFDVLLQEGFVAEFSAFDGEVEGSALLYLSQNGALEYRIRAQPSSDIDPNTGRKYPSVFTVAYAGLVAQVPEGGATLAFLGLAVLTLGALQRHRP